MEAGYNPFSELSLPTPHPLTMSSSSSGIADENFCLTANESPPFNTKVNRCPEEFRVVSPELQQLEWLGHSAQNNMILDGH